MELIKNIINISLIIILSLNILFYILTKYIKHNRKCLKKNNINLDYQSLKIIFTKYSSFLLSGLIILNYFVPIHKIVLKIPLISSIYSLIILIIIITQTIYLIGIIKEISNNTKKTQCFKSLNFIFKFNINKLIIKYKYKISLAYIFLTYICLIYI